METGAPLEDRIEPPHLIWWVLILGGIGFLALQALHAPFYDWYTATLHPLPSQSVMTWILLALIPIHIFEAVYVFRLAQKLGLNDSAPLWGLQTFMIGYPSTRLMLERARTHGA